MTPTEEAAPGASINEAIIGQTDQVASGSTSDERPEWLPEEFKDAAEFRAAWDKQQGTTAGLGDEGKEAVLNPKEGAAEGDTAKVEPATPTPEERATKTETIRASLKEAGGIYADPNYEKAALEFELDGKVSDETIAETAKGLGIDPSFVKQFIDNEAKLRELAPQVAANSAAAMETDLQSVAGGPEGYKEFMGWAGENLTDAQKTAYNTALGWGSDGKPIEGAHTDINQAKVLLGGFMDRYKAEGNGPAPRDVTVRQGGSAGGNAGQGYATRSEQQAAMADKRYGNDAAYTHGVERKSMASDF